MIITNTFLYILLVYLIESMTERNDMFESEKEDRVERLEEIKDALQNQTEYTKVSITEDLFVYAMLNDQTGMKFEAPGMDATKFAFSSWVENKPIKKKQGGRGTVPDNLSLIVDKANEIHTKLQNRKEN